nr:MAG TPA: hypothetical protein [Crassvirales sp.]
MTQEKVDKLLEFARELEEKVVVVTKTQLRVYINFSDEEYKDTHVFNDYLYVWDTDFHRWTSISLNDVEFIEFY